MIAGKQGGRIVWFVRLLAAIGLTMVVITVWVVSWTLAGIRVERARALAAQERLNEVSQELRQRAIACRMEIQTLLDESAVLGNHGGTATNLETWVQKQLVSHPDPAVVESLRKLQTETVRMVDLSDKANAWRTQYLIVWEDLRAQKTLNEFRELISQMRNGIEAFEGRRRLEDAAEYRAWRNASADAAAQQARAILLNQAKPQSHDAANLKNELAELARLAELLGGEERFDSLVDLKDNRLKPALDKMKRSASAFDTVESDTNALALLTVEKLEIILFGEGYVSDEAHQTILPGRGGLFALRRDALLLRRDRENLKNDLAALFQDIEAADEDFSRSAQARTAALSQQVEQNLTKSWRHLLLLGGGCSILFLWLGWLVTRDVKVQVQVLERARAEAESSHQTTQKLMLEQLTAAKELAAAHKDLQASEQRFRMLNVSAPIGIFLTDHAGSCLYTNPHWQHLTGLSPEQSLGDGWSGALHPDDSTRVFTNWKTAADGGSGIDCEFRFRRLNGDERWVHARSAAIRAESGEVTGHVGTVEDITDRKLAEAELEKVHKALIESSRHAGMAEVATSVLHNVGNVLNSINVAANIICDQVKKSRGSNVTRVADLMNEHAADLGNFITNHPKGLQLPIYLKQLGDLLAQEQSAILKELESLKKNVEHVKDIVAVQQSYSKVSGLVETLKVTDIVEDALRMNATALSRHELQVFREYDPNLPEIVTEKHKVLQILVNLIRNAKFACDESGSKEKRMTMRVRNGGDFVKIDVIDNGVGIPQENLTRIFNHGFTTRKDGHGFGLHSGALSAKELGGTLAVRSEGVGKGAAFTLELPAKPKEKVV